MSEQPQPDRIPEDPPPHPVADTDERNLAKVDQDALRALEQLQQLLRGQLSG
jgi:hypothetical protein